MDEQKLPAGELQQKRLLQHLYFSSHTSETHFFLWLKFKYPTPAFNLLSQTNISELSLIHLPDVSFPIY